jgi:putative PIN family toxin of toxin-antitoxin system
MKIFFDTNVLVSAFVARGYSYDVVKDAVFKHELYCSKHIVDEIERILPNKFHLSATTTNAALALIKRYFIHGRSASHVEQVCRDGEDDQVLADAALEGVDLIITGDKDLLVLKKHKNIKIIMPREYWHL